MKIAVIGGGWAGIAAAVELAHRGASVTLFEAGRQLGGRARRADTADGSLDNGQHLLLGAYTDTLALMQRVGADPARLLRRLPLEVRDNRGFRLALPPWAPPLNLAWGLLTARGVPLGEKLRTALWMQGLKYRQFRLKRDSSVSHWLDAAGQTGVLRQRLWEPLCLAALNTPPALASAQRFARVLRDSLGSPLPGATDLLLPRQTLSELLPDPAGAWLQAQGARVLTRRRVRQLQQDGAGWRVEEEQFDQLILAVAPQHLAALLPGPGLPLPDYRYEPIATLYFHYPADTALPFPLMALHGGHGQWLVDRGQGVIAASLSGHGPWETLEETALAAALHEEICSFTGPRPLPPYRLIKEQRATFACTPDLPACPQTTPWPGLWIAGDHCWADYPATLEGAVRSGLAAARLSLAARRT